MPDYPVAIYARTSSPAQQSCDSQLHLCRKLVDDRGWRLAFRLKDEAFQGHQFDRPAYSRLLELVEERRVQAVVTWKLDRLFRSLKEASAAQEFFAHKEVAIISVTEPFDTTTTIGRFVFGFLANVGQFETDLIRDRTELGYERRTHEGRWTGPHLPFGYRSDPDGKMQVDQSEAQTLQVMHSKYATCKGDGQLAQWLNQHGYAWRGTPFTTERVRRALTNPVTMGDLTQRRSRQHHKHLAIIKSQRFRQTQHQRQQLQHLGKHQGRVKQEALDEILNAYLADLRNEAEATH